MLFYWIYSSYLKKGWSSGVSRGLSDRPLFQTDMIWDGSNKRRAIVACFTHRTISGWVRGGLFIGIVGTLLSHQYKVFLPLKLSKNDDFQFRITISGSFRSYLSTRVWSPLPKCAVRRPKRTNWLKTGFRPTQTTTIISQKQRWKSK